jgi:hypothetical protein
VKHYGELLRQDGAWLVRNVPPHVAIRLKANFPRIAKSDTNNFKFPDIPIICADLEWFLNRYPMEMTAADRSALTGNRELFEANRADVEKILLPDWQPPIRYGFKPGFGPRPEQNQAVEITRKLGRLLLADTVGSGKTWSAMGLLVGSPYLPAAIVASTHLPSQWGNEYIKPHTYLSTHIIRGRTVYNLPPANCYFFKYSNIAAWSDIAATGIFKTFICDEVHHLRTGPTTDKYAAAQTFATHALEKLFMSGTPIFNYGDEIFYIIDLLDPGALGERHDFIREWCTTGPGGKWIVKDPVALGTYLREMQIILRRVRNGERINRIVIEVETDQRIERESVEFARMLAQQVLTGSFQESGQAARELDALSRKVTGLAKAKSVAAYVRILLDAGLPVLLAGWHRDVYQIWLDDLGAYRPVMFTGSESPKQKDQAKHDFISGKTNLMFISLRSGEGLDGLQKRCSTVVFGELDWSPEVHKQVIGRLGREGQAAGEITAIFLVSNSGSDPVIQGVLGLKQSQSRGVMDPSLGVEVVHTDITRLKSLAKSYLKRR